MRRILVTGSGIWTDERKMAGKIIPSWFSRDDVLVTGHASGADLMAERLWAGALGMTPHLAAEKGHIEIHPADWTAPCRESCRDGHRRWKNGRAYCPAAGGYRNTEMIALGASVCLAFACRCRKQKCKKGPVHYTHGTYDCVTKARRAGIPEEWTVEDE